MCKRVLGRAVHAACLHPPRPPCAASRAQRNEDRQPAGASLGASLRQSPRSFSHQGHDDRLQCDAGRHQGALPVHHAPRGHAQRTHRGAGQVVALRVGGEPCERGEAREGGGGSTTPTGPAWRGMRPAIWPPRARPTLRHPPARRSRTQLSRQSPGRLSEANCWPGTRACPAGHWLALPRAQATPWACCLLRKAWCPASWPASWLWGGDCRKLSCACSGLLEEF